MSFNYNHLSNNQMHALMPSLMGNLANGANFLQSIPGMHPNGDDFSAKSPPGSLPGQPGHMNSELEIRLNGGVAKQPGLGMTPMDIHKGQSSSNPSGMPKLDTGEDHPSKSLFNGGGAGQTVVGMPQNFMMLSRMMMDPTMLGIQAAAAANQFPMFGQLPPQLGPPPQGPPPPQQQQMNPQNQQQSQQPQLSIHQQQQQIQLQSQQSTNLNGEGSLKELISTPSCTLFPPNPTVPPPTTRDRPPGCRTVFVGGLPENVTEEIIREVFDRCGEITTLRLSKKNFCHIRFVFESSVDSAIYLSGYRMRIGNQSDAANCGRLHVDYAQARDDQYEFECKQRQLQREHRHRERMERDRLRPASPPMIVHYTDHEAGSVSEKLKQDDTFAKAVQTLITWLERGDCSKKNSNTFYSMIQSTNSHVRRVAHDKQTCEEELRKAKDLYKKQMQSMLVQFNQIKKVFNAASHKKVSDHLTKAQRKNIEAWKRQVLEMRMEPMDDHEEDEMEMSDDERDRAMSPMKSNFGPPSSKRARMDNDSLKEENDSLKCQLQVYKNEVDLVKCDLKNDTDLKVKMLQETIRNMQTQLLENKAKEKESGQRVKELEEKLKSANVKELLLKTKIATSNSNNRKSCGSSGEASSASNDDQPVTQVGDSHSEATSEIGGAAALMATALKWERVDEDEARIISLVSAFLVVHPFGASTDYIWSYVSRFVPVVRPKGLEEILVRYSNLFVEDVTGVGAKIERKWRYNGFEGEGP